ncbi:uncharacterized protein LOC118417746 [Branchiostoma floridae]|uniref:Uncharacterized protein LOC118417746 n=1 Tax=Branchiostoma floridae TaxID=7739 RepID=A0A9J7MSI8_BRAFL|nr:uncharacterized protein LOC118417746 [Branchiostoma floridae]
MADQFLADPGCSATKRRGPGRPRIPSPMKRQKNKQKLRTRVNLGNTFEEWRALQQRLNVRTDRNLARKLLDSFKKKPEESVPRTSSPKHMLQSPTGPSLFDDESSVGAPSDGDSSPASIVGENICLSPRGQVLDAAVSRSPPCEVLENALSRSAEKRPESRAHIQDPENEKEINALENIGISVEVEEDMSEDDDDFSDSEEYYDDVMGDPDYEPPASLRAAYKLLDRDIETYDIITAEEEVFCHDMAPGVEDGSLGEESLTTDNDQSINKEQAIDESLKNLPREIRIERPEDIVDDKCSIIYKRCLEQLIGFLELPEDKRRCRECPAPVPPVHPVENPVPSVQIVASGMIVKWHCKNGHLVWRWFTQPRLKFGVQGGDFMQASSLLLSGNNYGKYSLMCKFMNLGCVNESTFYKIQRQYCVDTINQYWVKQQEEIVRDLRTKEEVILLGDGRMDSPGHCAQYCTYTALDNESRSIVAIEVVDKRETDRNSSVMEKDGFKKAMDDLLDKGVPITEVCTDAHPQISSLMRPDKGVYGKKGIFHSLDVWHGAKNLTKKLVKAGGEKGGKDLLPWTRDIVRHFWYCCKHANNYEEFIVLWKGVLHHVCNEHQWATGSCQHDPIDPAEVRTKPWLVKGTPAHEKLSKLILNKRWLKTTFKFLRFRTTSDLESFQNHILMRQPPSVQGQVSACCNRLQCPQGQAGMEE